jgi:phenylpropionate dioxygenase-like ring-hydroxylating dioxygenase large terminal subunit
VVDFDDDIRLAPFRIDFFAGFIFVCAATEEEQPLSLKQSLGDLPQQLPEWFGSRGVVEDMVGVGRAEYEVDCNWKFLMENTCETYHTSRVHKDSLGPMKSWGVGEHSGAWDAVRVRSADAPCSAFEHRLSRAVSVRRQTTRWLLRRCRVDH